MILPAGLVANALAEVTVYVGRVTEPVTSPVTLPVNVPMKPLSDATGPEKVVRDMMFFLHAN
jgi:hypothetical protein